MQDFLSDQSVNLKFRYGSGHEPVIPDVGSVTYTVYSHSGSPIAGLQNLPITTDAATFQSNINIPAINNSIDPSKDFERRMVIVSYNVSGFAYTQRIIYRLIPITNYTTVPQNVRSFLGVNENELPDSDIDLFNAFLFVSEAFADPALFTDALLSGTRMELLANDAITMRAAIDAIPSLQNRVAQAEKNGVMGFDRVKIKDFSALLEAATNRYNEAIEGIGLIDSVNADFTLIVVTQDTDPITAGT